MLEVPRDTGYSMTIGTYWVAIHFRVFTMVRWSLVGIRHLHWSKGQAYYWTGNPLLSHVYEYILGTILHMEDHQNSEVNEAKEYYSDVKKCNFRTSTWHSYSSRKYALEKQHLRSIWIQANIRISLPHNCIVQFLIAFFPLVICRLGWATVPFFTRVYYYNFLNFAFGYAVLYGIPLRPVIANIALLITVRVTFVQ